MKVCKPRVLSSLLQVQHLLHSHLNLGALSFWGYCLFSMHIPKAQFAELMLRSLPAGKWGAVIPFILRDARSAHRGTSVIQICCHSRCCITFSRRHHSSFQPVVTWGALLAQSPPNIPAAQLKYQGRGRDTECVFLPTPPPVKQHSLNVPMAIILAQSIFSPLCKAEAGRLCPFTEPRAACSSQHPCPQQAICPAPLPTGTHPAAVRCRELQYWHLLLAVHSGAASLQETGIIAFHLQEDKRIKPSERFR